ncbi:MAG TPA: host-nuclease inhibitor Gam family protein [Acidimicrobiales bacterium]
MSDDDLVEKDLDEWLDIEIPVREIPGADGAPPTVEVLPAPDEAAADLLLYRLSRREEEAARYRAIAEARIAPVRAWLADRLFGVEKETVQLSRSLELYLRFWVRFHKRTKTLSLPNGQLSLSKPREKVVVTDEAAFLGWAREHNLLPEPMAEGSLIRMEPKANKKSLAALDRSRAPQQTIDGVLCEVDRLLTTVEVLDVLDAADDGPKHPEQVTIPGVFAVRAVEDVFKYKTPTENGDPDSDRSADTEEGAERQ